MENVPKFIKEFSKTNDQTERDNVAMEIRSMRKSYFQKEEVGVEQSKENKENISTELENIKKLEDETEQLNKSGISKFLNFFKLRKLRADILAGYQNQEILKTNEKDQLRTSIAEKNTTNLETKSLLDDFYKKQKEKWQKSEYSKENIAKYFTEENLASLSLEDYSLLMRRFPSEMITHVTRQGIRDHTGHMSHTAGVGEYHTGFMDIADMGTLHSALSVAMTEEEKKEKIESFLINKDIDTKEDALNRLKRITNSEWQRQDAVSTFADKSAIHFAAEGVADKYYGAERGNEIFIAFPSAFIASQYKFHGQLTDQGDMFHNDQWVWTNEEKGIDINTGIVFIPGDAKVDSKTGSRYEINEKNNPVVNEEYKALLKKIVDSNDFNIFAKEIMEVTNYPNPSSDKLQKLRDRLSSEYGIIDNRLQDVVLNYWNLNDLKSQKEQGEKNINGAGSIDSLIERGLKDEGILYKKSTNTIDSKEYWENYFKEHPDKKPTKIVYYESGDPTRALMQWKSINRISKEGKKYNLGFNENEIHANEYSSTLGRVDRFKSIGEQIIDEYFEDRKMAV